MDLKDIQGRLKQLSSEHEIPAQKNERTNTSLTQRIIKQDKSDRRKILFGMSLIIFVVIYYAILSYRCIHFERDLNELYFYGFASAGFLSVLPFFIYKYRKYGRFDYTENTIQFLEKAEKRFRFLCEEILYLIPFLVLFDIALCTVAIFKTEFWGLSNFLRVLLVQLFMIPYLALPLGIGYLVWRRKKRPILMEIKELRKQFTAPAVEESE